MYEILGRESGSAPTPVRSRRSGTHPRFKANHKVLELKGKRLQLGNGHTTTVADLERRLRAGAKSRGAGLLAVELRKLRG